MLIQANHITKRFSGVPLFSDVSMKINKQSRIGLVGRNGTGKSTLLKIIAGLEEASEGDMIKNQDISIGFLDQHNGLESDRTIWEEMLEVFEPLRQIEREMRQLEQLITEESANDQEINSQLMQKYHRLQEQFDRQNGYGYESEIKMILHGFKFPQNTYSKNISELSGGQKTRLALAKLLLEKKDLLILDEPTNHLDIDTLNWLERYLTTYRQALLIVSHDRYFLDQIVTEIYELNHHGQLHYYTGNYSDYLDKKAKRLLKEQKDYEKQQKEIHELEQFIERNIVRASTTKRAQSRRKKLEKMDRLEKPIAEMRSPHFSFLPERESGNLVLQTDDLAIGYDGHTLAQHINLDIRKGDAIALVGPNGIGKTTLLKTLNQQLSPIAGSFELGSKVDMGYFDQEQVQLNQHHTVLDELWNEQPTYTEETIRTFLGSFLFSGDDVKKMVSALSGGERARLALAKLAIQNNNFLMLDEPTNHLDIDAKEILEESLIDFSGTILFVSHDRYFINRIADKVVELDGETTQLYLGDYDYYLNKKEQFEAIENFQKENSPAEAIDDKELTEPDTVAVRKEQKARQRQERRLKRALKQVEEKILTLEANREEIEQIMAEPDFYQDIDQSRDYTNKYQAIEKQLDTLYQKWENLIDQADGL